MFDIFSSDIFSLNGQFFCFHRINHFHVFQFLGYDLSALMKIFQGVCFVCMSEFSSLLRVIVNTTFGLRTTSQP